MLMSKNRRLQVLIEEDQWRRLESVAAERGVTVATVVREAIDASVPGAPDERVAAAQSILEAGRMPVGDPADLRAELDELRSRRG
jgi:predicted DNA-binding protein